MSILGDENSAGLRENPDNGVLDTQADQNPETGIVSGTREDVKRVATLGLAVREPEDDGAAAEPEKKRQSGPDWLGELDDVISPLDRSYVMAANSEVEDGNTHQVVRKARKLAEEGKIAELKDLVTKYCQAFDVYQRLYEATGEDRRNFMQPKDEPHPIIKTLVTHRLADAGVQGRLPMIRILELGSGIGNDGLYLLKALYKLNLRNRASYLGIEGTRKAIDIMRERAVGLDPSYLPRFDLKEGNFKKHLREKAMEAQDYLNVMTRLGGNAQKIARLRRRAVIKDEFPTDIVSVSTLHYDFEEDFLPIITNIRDILLVTGGSFTFALKRPDSDSCNNHAIIYESQDKGYKLGLHRREGIMRAFMDWSWLIEEMDKAGFDMKKGITHPKAVMGYDYYGQREMFTCGIAEARQDF